MHLKELLDEEGRGAHTIAHELTVEEAVPLLADRNTSTLIVTEGRDLERRLR